MPVITNEKIIGPEDGASVVALSGLDANHIVAGNKSDVCDDGTIAMTLGYPISTGSTYLAVDAKKTYVYVTTKIETTTDDVGKVLSVVRHFKWIEQ